jgi:hypothetical protein
MLARLLWVLLFASTPAMAAQFDVALYYGYWSSAPTGMPKVELVQPNYYLISQGKTTTDPGLKFEADAKPLIVSDQVLDFSATEVTRLPSGGSLVRITLAESAQESLGRAYVQWVKDADPLRNLLLVSGGRVLIILELGQVWLSGDTLLFLVGNKSEGRMLEQAVRR